MSRSKTKYFNTLGKTTQARLLKKEPIIQRSSSEYQKWAHDRIKLDEDVKKARKQQLAEEKALMDAIDYREYGDNSVLDLTGCSYPSRIKPVQDSYVDQLTDPGWTTPQAYRRIIAGIACDISNVCVVLGETAAQDAQQSKYHILSELVLEGYMVSLLSFIASSLRKRFAVDQFVTLAPPSLRDQMLAEKTLAASQQASLDLKVLGSERTDDTVIKAIKNATADSQLSLPSPSLASGAVTRICTILKNATPVEFEIIHAVAAAVIELNNPASVSRKSL